MPITQAQKRAFNKYLENNKEKHRKTTAEYYEKVKYDPEFKQKVSEQKKKYYLVKKEFRAFLMILLDD